ncbi:MAG TPA: hypothetical protein VHR40_03800 [Thermoleophilaceae bacterium]|nr:hypothetical protein [Thermoleophilaceae bacterium]
MSQSQADGESDRRRSVPLLDPVAGMRAMADIQAEGLRAASELLERMLRAEPDAPERRPPADAGAYTALVDAWTDLLRRTVAGLAQPGEPGVVTVPLGASGVGPPVRLTLRDGEAPAAEVWLHNGTFAPIGPLALSCGPLADCEGGLLEGVRVRFEPASVEPLPPRSSRAIAVSLKVKGAPAPGTYRGAIQADGAPALWLPLEVEVG